MSPAYLIQHTWSCSCLYENRSPYPQLLWAWGEWKAILRSRKRHVCFHLVWCNTNSFSVGCSAFSEHPEEYPPRRLWPNCTTTYQQTSSCVCVHAVSLRLSENADLSTTLHLASSIGQLNPIESQQTSALELLLVCYFRILLAYQCTLYLWNANYTTCARTLSDPPLDSGWTSWAYRHLSNDRLLLFVSDPDWSSQLVQATAMGASTCQETWLQCFHLSLPSSHLEEVY